MGTVYTPVDLFHLAKQNGFSDTEALYVVGTAAAESSLGVNRGSSSAGALGLLQFMPTTFYGTPTSKGAMDPSCQDINSDICQLKAFKNLTSGNFVQAWQNNWYVNWDAKAKQRYKDALQNLVDNIGQLQGVTVYDGPGVPGNVNPPPTVQGIEKLTNAFDAAGGLANLPGTAGKVVSGIVPYIVLLAAILIVLVFLLREIGSKSVPTVKVQEQEAAQGDAA